MTSEASAEEESSSASPLSIATNRGYGHPRYASSLSEFGRPVELPLSAGHALIRPVPGTSCVDAMGVYPVLVCDDWAALTDDLEAHRREWVSFTFVVDPFGPTKQELRQQPLDVVRPFKSHWLVDLSIPYEEAVSKHHRYYARRAGREGVQTRRIETPTKHLDLWTNLYEHLIERHDITGLQAFSRAAFEKQLDVPGMTMFVAFVDEEPVGAHLWYAMDDVVYSHLAAQNETGYDLFASYALHKAALDYFRPSAQWLSLGGGAGAPSDELDGLGRFKKGWATTHSPSHLCGFVLDREAYDTLASSAPTDDYFPAYRSGEMT